MLIDSAPTDAVFVNDILIREQEQSSLQESMTSNLFFLSLFVQPSPTFECPTSVNANHRRVDFEAFTLPNDRGSVINEVIKKVDSRDFQTFLVCAFPYVISEVLSDSNPTLNTLPDIRTFGPEHLNWTKDGLESNRNCDVILTNLRGNVVTEKVYFAACYFVNRKPRLSNLEDGSVAFDWDVIFNCQNTLTGCSNDALDGFCEKLKLPFRCLKNKSTACNNRRFRRFI